MTEDGLEPYGAATQPSTDRRLRAGMVAAAVALLVAGTGAGFAAGWVGRGSSPPSTSVASRSAAAGPSSPPVPSGQSTPPTSPSEKGAGYAVAVGGVIGSGVSTSTGLIPSATLLGRWTTSDGITVRAYLYHYPGAVGPPTPACGGLPGEVVTVELSDTEAVLETEVPIYTSTTGMSRVAGAGMWGVSEGAPAGWAVIVTSPKVDQVAAAFDGGTTDQVAPVSGIAVVASRLRSASGGVTGTVTTGGAGESSSVPLRPTPGPMQVGSCSPIPPVTVPTLPPAGAQPADPSAAKAGVTKAVGALFGGVPTAEEFQYVQGSDPTVETAQKTASGNNPNARVGDTVEQIVFTSPTAATVRYQILLNGNPVISNQISQVVLDAGTWKMTRASACAIYALGGGHC